MDETRVAAEVKLLSCFACFVARSSLTASTASLTLTRGSLRVSKPDALAFM